MHRCSPLRLSLLAACAVPVGAVPAAGQDFGAPGKLLLTNGVSTIEGAAGGGLTPWAVIAGNATKDGIGAQAAASIVELPDYDFASISGAVGAWNRIELSYARQVLDTNRVGGALGLGNDFKFDQDVFGIKMRIAGDVVYGPEWMPSIAVGAQYKKSLDAPVVQAIGAAHGEGAEYYAVATKLFLRWSLLANVTVRATKANQLGLLGHGGALGDRHRLQWEGSITHQLSRRLVIGTEFRSKPSNLAIAREDDWFDIFAAYGINRHLTATIAYADLGSVATFDRQRGMLLQIQGSF